MKKVVVSIGIGEMGGVFARGFLKAGYPVYPVGRGTDLVRMADEIDDPEAVIIGVGEKDLPGVLKGIPDPWHDRLVLMQNELLPGDWEIHNIESPTVISAWFEKKPGQDVKVLVPSPVFGPNAVLVKKALHTVGIDCIVLSGRDELLFELVVKNVYILTVNIAGLEVGGTVGELWDQHRGLARKVAGDVMDIQFCLIEKELDRQAIIDGMVKAFKGDLGHKCLGRSAAGRLERAVKQADRFGLEVKQLREILSHQVRTGAPKT